MSKRKSSKSSKSSKSNRLKVGERFLVLLDDEKGILRKDEDDCYNVDFCTKEDIKKHIELSDMDPCDVYMEIEVKGFVRVNTNVTFSPVK